MRYSELSKEQKQVIHKIGVLKSQLRKTDYITDKLTEAIVEYIVNDNKPKVVELYNEYKDLLTKRQQYRDGINELETQLQAMQTTEGESD